MPQPPTYPFPIESKYIFDFHSAELKHLDAQSTREALLLRLANPGISHRILAIENCHCLTKDTLQTLTKNSPNLQMLALVNCKGKEKDDLYQGMVNLPNDCPELKILIVDGSDISDVARYGSFFGAPKDFFLHHLAYLSANNCLNLDCIVVNAQQLKTLQLDYTPRLSKVLTQSPIQKEKELYYDQIFDLLRRWFYTYLVNVGCGRDFADTQSYDYALGSNASDIANVVALWGDLSFFKRWWWTDNNAESALNIDNLRQYNILKPGWTLAMNVAANYGEQIFVDFWKTVTDMDVRRYFIKEKNTNQETLMHSLVRRFSLKTCLFVWETLSEQDQLEIILDHNAEAVPFLTLVAEKFGEDAFLNFWNRLPENNIDFFKALLLTQKDSKGISLPMRCLFFSASVRNPWINDCRQRFSDQFLLDMFYQTKDACGWCLLDIEACYHLEHLSTLLDLLPDDFDKAEWIKQSPVMTSVEIMDGHDNEHPTALVKRKQWKNNFTPTIDILGNNPAHRAAYRGALGLLKLLQEQASLSVWTTNMLTETNVDGMSILTYALREGHYDCAKWIINHAPSLLTKHTKLNGRDASPLAFALMHFKESRFSSHAHDMICLLLKNGVVLTDLDKLMLKELGYSVDRSEQDQPKLIQTNASDPTLIPPSDKKNEPISLEIAEEKYPRENDVLSPMTTVVNDEFDIADNQQSISNRLPLLNNSIDQQEEEEEKVLSEAVQGYLNNEKAPTIIHSDLKKEPLVLMENKNDKDAPFQAIVTVTADPLITGYQAQSPTATFLLEAEAGELDETWLLNQDVNFYATNAAGDHALKLALRVSLLRLNKQAKYGPINTLSDLSPNADWLIKNTNLRLTTAENDRFIENLSAIPELKALADNLKDTLTQTPAMLVSQSTLLQYFNHVCDEHTEFCLTNCLFDEATANALSEAWEKRKPTQFQFIQLRGLKEYDCYHRYPLKQLLDCWCRLNTQGDDKLFSHVERFEISEMSDVFRQPSNWWIHLSSRGVFRKTLMKTLCETLDTMPNLKHLDLHDMGLNDDHVQLLIDYLAQRQSPLLTVNISDNPAVTPATEEKLIACLKQQQQMATLQSQLPAENLLEKPVLLTQIDQCYRCYVSSDQLELAVHHNENIDQDEEMSTEKVFRQAYEELYLLAEQTANAFLPTGARRTQLEEAYKSQSVKKWSQSDTLQFNAIRLLEVLKQTPRMLVNNPSKNRFIFSRLHKAYYNFIGHMGHNHDEKTITPLRQLLTVLSISRRQYNMFTKASDDYEASSIPDKAGYTPSQKAFFNKFTHTISTLYLSSASICSGTQAESDRKFTMREEFEAYGLSAVSIACACAKPLAKGAVKVISKASNTIANGIEKGQAMAESVMENEAIGAFVEGQMTEQGNALLEKLIKKTTGKKLLDTHSMLSNLSDSFNTSSNMSEEVCTLAWALIKSYEAQLALLTPMEAEQWAEVCANHMLEGLMLGLFTGREARFPGENAFVKRAFYWMAYAPMEEPINLGVGKYQYGFKKDKQFFGQGDRVFNADVLLKGPSLRCEDDQGEFIDFHLGNFEVEPTDDLNACFWRQRHFSHKSYDHPPLGYRLAMPWEVQVLRDPQQRSHVEKKIASVVITQPKVLSQTSKDQVSKATPMNLNLNKCRNWAQSEAIERLKKEGDERDKKITTLEKENKRLNKKIEENKKAYDLELKALKDEVVDIKVKHHKEITKFKEKLKEKNQTLEDIKESQATQGEELKQQKADIDELKRLLGYQAKKPFQKIQINKRDEIEEERKNDIVSLNFDVTDDNQVRLTINPNNSFFAKQCSNADKCNNDHSSNLSSPRIGIYDE